MFKEVMIDPELWGNWVFSSSVFPQLGSAHGRLVSGFPRGKQQLSDAYRQIGQQVQGHPRRKEKLKVRAKKAIESLSVKNPYRNNQTTGDWIQSVIAESGRLPSDIVLTEKSGINAMSPDEVSDGLEQWDLPQTQRIYKNAKAMVLALESLIKLSRRLILVDKYFDPRARKFAPFADQFMGQIERYEAISRIDIHFSKHDMSESHLASWVKEKTKSWVKVPTFNFYKWDEGDLHYRVFLSELGGLSSEYGFDTRDQVQAGVPSDKSLFSRLGQKDFSDMYELFTRGCQEKNQANLVCSIDARGGRNEP